jgi:hypothetical protein
MSAVLLVSALAYDTECLMQLAGYALDVRLTSTLPIFETRLLSR